MCINREARKRLARRHSCNSCHMFVCIVICACSRHALDFKMLFLRSFMTRKDYCVNIFNIGASQNYCVSHLSSRRSDCGLTMQVSCFQDKANMRAGAKGDTPRSSVGTSVLYVFMYSKRKVQVVVYSALIRPNKIAAKGVGVPYLGVAGCHAWPKTWGGRRTLYIIYTE